MLMLPVELQACDWQAIGEATKTMHDYNALMQQQAAAKPTVGNR